MNKLEILYEDNHIIVVVKPFNILSQSDSTGDCDMLSIVKQYIKEKYKKPGNVYLALVHRLDRPTMGIMVFAKTSKAASRLAKQLQEHKFTKIYTAVIKGILKNDEGEFVDYLERKDEQTIISTKEKGKYAALSYKVINKNVDKNLSLVEIFLKTGRHHQIRVQFASRGYPIYGENRYQKAEKAQLSLVATSLSFNHPVTQKRLEFSIEIPKNISGFQYFQ